MRVGIKVHCVVCHRSKRPHGRSAPVDSDYCDEGCEGYLQAPAPGCLWPGESEAEFGWAVCSNAVVEMPQKQERPA